MKLRAKYAMVIAETLVFSLFLGLFVVGQAAAQVVDVSEAWARATVPGQKATGAFMKITAKDSLRLVGASSSAAGVTEVHEMKIEKGVMLMRAVPGGLEIKPGQTVELKPGSFHLMFMELKAPLVKDQTPRPKGTLVFEKAGNVEVEFAIEAIGGAPAEHKH